jgi:hypothetical protein
MASKKESAPKKEPTSKKEPASKKESGPKKDIQPYYVFSKIRRDEINILIKDGLYRFDPSLNGN